MVEIVIDISNIIESIKSLYVSPLGVGDVYYHYPIYRNKFAGYRFKTMIPRVSTAKIIRANWNPFSRRPFRLRRIASYKSGNV